MMSEATRYLHSVSLIGKPKKNIFEESGFEFEEAGGNRFAVMTDMQGERYYYLMKLPDGSRINEKNDSYFQVGRSDLAITAEEPGREYLVQLINPGNNRMMSNLHETRDVPDEPGERSSRELLIEALGDVPGIIDENEPPALTVARALPQLQTAFAMVTQWDPKDIFKKSFRESDDSYAARIERVVDLKRFKELCTQLNAQEEYLFNNSFNETYELKAHMMFISYYSQLDDRGRERFIDAIKKSKEGGYRSLSQFIEAFKACEAGWDVGDVIVEVMNSNPQANRVLQFNTELIKLRDGIEDGQVLISNFPRERIAKETIRKVYDVIERLKSEGKLHTYYSIVTKKSAELLGSVLRGESFEDLQKEFNSQDIVMGSFMATAIHAAGDDIPELRKTLDALFGGTAGIRIVKGDSDMVGNPIKMNSESSYKYPGKFGPDEYKILCGYLDRAYWVIDPEWCRYLKRNIARDLCDPKVTLCMITGNKGQLIGISKIKVISDGSDGKRPVYYFGTHYVDPSLQKNYLIGTLMQNMAIKYAPEGAEIIATVATANDATERHIEKNGIGTRIVTEGDERGTSGELLQFSWNYSGRYEGKKMNKDEIRARAITIDETASPPTEEMLVYRLNAKHGENKQYVDLCRRLLGDGGYVMTRFFTNQGDMGETHVVFEKNTEISS